MLLLFMTVFLMEGGGGGAGEVGGGGGEEAGWRLHLIGAMMRWRNSCRANGKTEETLTHVPAFWKRCPASLRAPV